MGLDGEIHARAQHEDLKGAENYWDPKIHHFLKALLQQLHLLLVARQKRTNDSREGHGMKTVKVYRQAPYKLLNWSICTCYLTGAVWKKNHASVQACLSHVASLVARSKPSSSHPVIPPIITFTGRPNWANRIAPRVAPLQCGPAQYVTKSVSAG